MGRRIPRAFFWRRIHSLAGVWLVIFLIEHLVTNSQAALFVGEDGRGFIHAVNSIRALPYLPVIEILLLGAPFALHGLWGLLYLKTGRLNSFQSDGSAPSLPQYPRNRAYSWQRITSWILLAGVVAHVVHMRFLEYPASVRVEGKSSYMVALKRDEGLETLAPRLDVKLLDKAEIETILAQAARQAPAASQKERQEVAQKALFSETLAEQRIEEGEVVAVAGDFGTAELLMVRETFKSPLMMALYTLFVVAACHHGFNGLWTALISWGVTLTTTSQRLFLRVSKGLMYLLIFLGLAAVWGTYWINLRS